MAPSKLDPRKRDARYWEAHFTELGEALSKPASAIARQRLPQWCAAHGGLTAAELADYLKDVQSVFEQAGVRQGVVRRPPQAPPADLPPGRPKLRLIK